MSRVLWSRDERITKQLLFFFSAIFLPPAKEVTSLYDLFWMVGVNDFILKFVAVIAKIGLIFVPGKLLPYQKRVS